MLEKNNKGTSKRPSTVTEGKSRRRSIVKEPQKQTLYQKKGSTLMRTEHPKARRKIQTREELQNKRSTKTRATDALPKGEKGSTLVWTERLKARRKI